MIVCQASQGCDRQTKKPRRISRGLLVPNGVTYLMASLRALTGRAFTVLLAGLALKMAGWPVKGLMPSRWGTAGFLTVTNLIKPGSTTSPAPPLLEFLVDDFVHCREHGGHLLLLEAALLGEDGYIFRLGQTFLSHESHLLGMEFFVFGAGRA